MHLIPMTDRTIWSRLLLHSAIAKMQAVSLDLLFVFLPYILAFGHLVAVVVIVFIALVIVVTH